MSLYDTCLARCGSITTQLLSPAWHTPSERRSRFDCTCATHRGCCGRRLCPVTEPPPLMRPESFALMIRPTRSPRDRLAFATTKPDCVGPLGAAACGIAAVARRRCSLHSTTTRRRCAASSSSSLSSPSSWLRSRRRAIHIRPRLGARRRARSTTLPHHRALLETTRRRDDDRVDRSTAIERRRRDRGGVGFLDFLPSRRAPVLSTRDG